MANVNHFALAMKAHCAWSELISKLSTADALKVLRLAKQTLEDDIRSYEAWDDEEAETEATNV